jgi:hypothetical protein
MYGPNTVFHRQKINSGRNPRGRNSKEGRHGGTRWLRLQMRKIQTADIEKEGLAKKKALSFFFILNNEARLREMIICG